MFIHKYISIDNLSKPMLFTLQTRMFNKHTSETKQHDIIIIIFEIITYLTDIQ